MLKRILVALAALTLLTFAWAAPASADTVTGVAIGGTAVVFTIDPATVVQLLLAVIMPILVALVTTKVTASAVKAWMLAGLTLITSLLVELARALTDGSAYNLGIALLAALPAFAISVATHYGLWKPTGTSDRVLAVGVKEPTG